MSKEIEELVTDEQLETVWGNANFGSISKRDLIKNTLLKCAFKMRLWVAFRAYRYKHMQRVGISNQIVVFNAKGETLPLVCLLQRAIIMTLQPHQDAGKIRNWAKVERYGYQEAQGGTLKGRVDTSYGMMILTNGGQTAEIYAPTDKEAHTKAVEFINGL